MVLSARGLNSQLRIVSKASDRRLGDKFTRVGADAVVAPNELGGRRLFAEMHHPTITAFLESLLEPSNLDLHVREPTPASAHAAGGSGAAGGDSAALRRRAARVRQSRCPA